jgi:hypothetical protein
MLTYEPVLHAGLARASTTAEHEFVVRKEDCRVHGKGLKRVRSMLNAHDGDVWDQRGSGQRVPVRVGQGRACRQ